MYRQTPFFPQLLVVSFLSVLEISTENQLQNLDKAVCISYYANTVVKGLNPIILLLAMDKY